MLPDAHRDIYGLVSNTSNEYKFKRVQMDPSESSSLHGLALPMQASPSPDNPIFPQCIDLYLLQYLTLTLSLPIDGTARTSKFYSKWRRNFSASVLWLNPLISCLNLPRRERDDINRYDFAGVQTRLTRNRALIPLCHSLWGNDAKTCYCYARGFFVNFLSK